MTDPPAGDIQLFSSPGAIGAIARYPAVWAAMCLMGGIAVHRAMPIEPELFILTAAALLAGALITFKRGWLSCCCLAGGLAAGGVALSQLEFFQFPANDIGLFTSSEPSVAELELIVQSPPRQSLRIVRSKLPARQQLNCRVLGVRTTNGWRAADGELTVWISQAHPALRTGSRFRAFGSLSRPQPVMNPGEFDWAQYSRRQRVLATFGIRGPGQIAVLGTQSRSALQWVRAKARQCLDAGFPPGLDRDLLRALLLGERGPELRPIQDEFQHTGTSHHLATSGMHVGVVALLMYGICRLLCWPPRRSTLIALAVMLLYGAVVVPSPPIVRSILLAGAIGGGILLGRRTHAIQLLALAMLIMLIYRPLDLYSAGFQLSFAAVAALMLFTRPLSDYLHRQPDSALKAQGRIRRWVGGKFVTIAATGVAAWFVCAPLVAWHFRQFNPFAIAAGALLEPLVFLCLVAGAFKIVLTALLPYLAGWWAVPAAVPAAALRKSVAVLAAVPGTDWIVPSPPVAATVAWYVLICLPLFPWPKWKKPKRLGPLAACLMGTSFLFFGGNGIADGTAQLSILSVGAGQCAVAELPHGHAVIFDAGSEANAHLFRSSIEPYLRLRGIRRIDAIFISHPNIDHFNAVGELIRRFDVGSIYLTRQFIAEAHHNASAAALLEELHARNSPMNLLTSGDRIRLNDATSVAVLWPTDDPALQDNNASLVLSLEHGTRRILLTGDIQSEAQQRLLADPAPLSADVLIAPHHGSSEPTTSDFVKAVDPRWIVSSNDHTLTKKQRDFEKMIGACPLYRTDRSGAVTITMDAIGGIAVEPFLPARHLPDRFIQPDSHRGG